MFIVPNLTCSDNGDICHFLEYHNDLISCYYMPYLLSCPETCQVCGKIFFGFLNVSYTIEFYLCFRNDFSIYFFLFFISALPSTLTTNIPTTPAPGKMNRKAYCCAYHYSHINTYFYNNWLLFINYFSSVCEDERTTKSCQKMKQSCGRVRIKQQCPLTCDACCKNFWSDSKCQRRKGKCKETRVKRNCRNTCECLPLSNK